MSEDVYIENVQVGDRFYSGEEIELTAEDIIRFAREFDPQPGHLSEEEALATPFKGLSASGWHTAAITMRLVVGLRLVGIIGRSITISWPTAARPGDRLHVDLRVTGKRASATTPGRGVVNLEYDTINQHGEVRQHTEAVIVTWDNKEAFAASGADS